MQTQTSNLTAENVKHLRDYFFATANQKIKEVEEKGLKVLNFGMGTPDLPPPQAVLETLEHLVQQPIEYRYPSYIGLPALRHGIADWYQREYQVTLDESNILPVAGSKQAIFFTSLAFLDPNDEVLIPDPGYPTYTGAAQLIGAKAKYYPLKETHHYLPDLETLSHEDLSQVKLMWINYPHNPTGAVATTSDLTDILNFTRENGIILASDNPYSHITFGDYIAPSLLQISRPDDLVIELDSMSKTYNLAGLRLGWITGNESLLTTIKTVYSNIETGIFTALQQGGLTALTTPSDWIEERNAIYQNRAKAAMQLCHKLGCTAEMPKASLYIWAKLPDTEKNSEDFCFELLAKKGIFVAPGTAFGSQGEGYIRLSLCQDETAYFEALTRIGTP